MTPEDLAKTHAVSFEMPRPWSAEEFAQLLQNPYIFVTGDTRAFAMGRVIADEVELLTLATHPRHRRQGLAQETLESFREIAMARGAIHAFLEVAANNYAAISLYSKNGYSTSGRRRDYYTDVDGSHTDALVLVCTLTQ